MQVFHKKNHVMPTAVDNIKCGRISPITDISLSLVSQPCIPYQSVSDVTRFKHLRAVAHHALGGRFETHPGQLWLQYEPMVSTKT